MQSQLSFRREKIALLLICSFAVGFRLVRLGALAFAADEETTTLAALALLEGWPPTLPGGLVYLRGLPFTFLEAIAVWTAGDLPALTGPGSRLVYAAFEPLGFPGPDSFGTACTALSCLSVCKLCERDRIGTLSGLAILYTPTLDSKLTSSACSVRRIKTTTSSRLGRRSSSCSMWRGYLQKAFRFRIRAASGHYDNWGRPEVLVPAYTSELSPRVRL